MADHVPSSTAELLKQFSKDICSSSTKQRVEIAGEVIKCVTETDLPENALKGILKLLCPTISFYNDSKSLRASLKLVEAVTKKDPKLSLKTICTLLTPLAEKQKTVKYASRSSSGDALVALSWTCVALLTGFQDAGCEEFLHKLVELQSLFVYGALAGYNSSITKAAFRKLGVVWRSTPKVVEQYGTILQKMEASVFLPCIMSLYMKYLVLSKQEQQIEAVKEPFIDVYMKQVIGSRSKPPLIVSKVSQDILRHCNHGVFKEKILPSALKALLRNPEIILEGFAHMLSGLQLDLSQYGMEIIKPIGAQLVSKEQMTREEACLVVANLAKQCSDHEMVEKIVKHIFGVFTGSEGKLTLVEQKISVIQAIGNMSQNTVSGTGTLHSLSTSVAELFIPILSAEVHEGTLTTILSVLSLWCAKFYTSVPDKLLQWFKKGMTLKSATSAVRNAYILCMNASFHGDTLSQAMDMITLLIQSVEKAVNQPSQSALVTEAISAGNLLLKLSSRDINAESKLGPFWNSALDSEKKLFVNDKYLSSVNSSALEGVVTLAVKLILEYPHKLNEKITRPYYRAIVYCLTRKEYSIRKFTQRSVKQMLALLGGTAHALSLLELFDELLKTQKVIDLEALNMEENEKETMLEQMKYVSPRILSQAVVVLSSVQSAEMKDAVSVAKATLITSHHPCILEVVSANAVSYNPGTWTDILYGLKLDAKNFIRQNVEFCTGIVSTGEVIDESRSSALETLSRIAPDYLMKGFIDKITELLENSELHIITKDDYGIYLCEEGELYDKQLAESLKVQYKEDKNIRRENKLYSYKEQMEEIELRKEMEKKKGKPAQTTPKLTKKQEETLQAQLKKESEIRAKLTLLNADVCKACAILKTMVRGNPEFTSLYVKDLCRLLVPLLKSPLAAPHVKDSFTLLGTSLFADPVLGALVSYSTLRIIKPECDCSSEWFDEPQLKQVTRVINRLYTDSVTEDNSSMRFDSLTEMKQLFPATNFAFLFYFINCCLLGNGVAIDKDEGLMIKLLRFIEQHAKMRHDGDPFKKSDPSLFPLKELLYMLINIIGVSTANIQQYANSALREVALSAGGGEGCIQINNEEIYVLLKALESPCTAVREATLQALQCLTNVLPNIDDDFQVGLTIAQRIWVCSFDEEQDVKELAEKLLEELDLEEPFEEMCNPLVHDLIHNEEIVRKSAAQALAKTLECHQEYITPALDQLLELFNDKLQIPPPKLDEFGRQIGEPPQDEWTARSGIAMALGKISHIIPQDQLLLLFNFYIPKGLGDRSPHVRAQMRQAALANINVHGKENVSLLLPVFEEFLTNAPGTATYDTVRQGIVILMGSLAKHLDKEDPKVKPIVGQLISALSTPSQEVQESVAQCLPPLVPAIRSDAPELVKKLIDLLLKSDNYGERKGAAYGLAGLVRGLGITALKQLDIMTTLEDAVIDKKNPRRREGALFAYEMMCTMLGKLFEPYVVHILPHLLLCFGDQNPYVREAADDAAKAVMKMLTAHGVKLVLPSLLKGLEEDSWRTKAGAVELLGSMAYCAPKQLSQCLPSIVPKITEVLTDSHVKVQKAGTQALAHIGKVIRNPEIQAIVPVLLGALRDPAQKTNPCLQNLLATKFVHFIDAPSLALIMPVVERAFQDRATDTRKMAAQIIGNMYSLTDQKDLEPYIDKVIPGLQRALLDPVPEVRSVSSRALGAMVKGITGTKFDELMTWLMETLKSEGTSVDRSGAAQGLSEVVGGMGLQDLDKLMPSVIATTERVDIPPHVRDGYIMMYIYLPSVFKDDFKKYVGPIIPSILQALADESEFVRDTALRAGQRIINMYANTAIELLLPELEKGLFDDNWRIRFSSVQLLGDLLYIVSGVSGKMSTESAGEDDNFGTESSQQLIMKILGEERRNRVLSGLYMGRSDTALLVRQAALHVWKVIVSNTPRTLREILSTLFTLLLGCLASTSHDKRQVAARTLGDLVRKLGERVLPEIIPILEHGLDSDQSDQRQGVCIGLSEIMASTRKEHVVVYADSLIPTVKRALTDPLEEVREAAANTFDSLHNNIGTPALDGILPDLLEKLDDEDISERALDGLKQVMIVKSRTVLPYLVPQLTKPPINTKALSYLASVSGEALTRHLTKILPALMSALSEKAGTEAEEDELVYCKRVVLSVEDEVGVRTIMEELLGYTQSPDGPVCRASVTILHSFCENTRMDYEEYLPQLFRGLIALFTRTEPDVLLAAWECLNTITKNLATTAMLDHIQNVRQAVRFAVSELKDQELPGFSIPKKGIAPVLPIFREGILNGSPDIKEQAAIGLGEIINRTSAEALKPSVVNITGPLIRILGDRFTFNVKVAVLETLTLLLSKVGVMLKPFLPQLQTTFVKALNDPNRSVRLKSAEALGKLIVIHTRVDPLFTELHTGVKNTDDASVKDTMLQALRFCLKGAGSKMSPANRKQISGTVVELLSSMEDSTRSTAAGCVGVLCLCLPEEELTDLMIQHLLDTSASLDWTLRLGRSLALGVAIREANEQICIDKYSDGIKKKVLSLTESDRISSMYEWVQMSRIYVISSPETEHNMLMIPLCMSGYRCLGYMLYHLFQKNVIDTSLIQALLKGLKHDSNDVKQLIGVIVSYCTSSMTSPLELNNIKQIVPPLVMGTKEKNTLVRSNCEYALVSLLHLRKDDSIYKSVMSLLDAGMKDSLQETYSKSLRKLANQMEPPDRLDITLLI